MDDGSKAEVIIRLPLLERLLNGLGVVEGNITKALAEQRLLALEEAALSELIVSRQNEVSEVSDPHGHRRLQAALQDMAGLVSGEHPLVDVIAPEPAGRHDHKLRGVVRVGLKLLVADE